MLELNITTIIFQIINFVLFAIALYFLLFKKIIERANQKKLKNEEIQAEIERNKHESEKIKESLEKELAMVEQKIEKMVDEAEKRQEEERKQKLDETNHKIEQMTKRAHEEAIKAQQREYAKYNDQFIDTVIEITQYLLTNVAPDEVHQSFIQQIDSRIWELGKKEMRQVEAIRHSLEDRKPTAHLDTAKPISPELQAQLIRTLSALADRNVHLEVHLNPSLGAGAHIRLGDLVIENSFSAQLNELRNSISEKLNTSMN